jgi:hypothetical protein
MLPASATATNSSRSRKSNLKATEDIGGVIEERQYTAPARPDPIEPDQTAN